MWRIKASPPTSLQALSGLQHNEKNSFAKT
jgi:hypothetical protein